MLLIVTRKIPIFELFGGSATDELTGLMRQHADAVRAGGTTAALAVLDDADSMAELGMSPVSDSLAVDIRTRLQEIAGICEVRGDPVAHILLLGGDGIIPFFRLPNPVPAGVDPDQQVFSDNPYGFLDSPADWLAPTIGVGRICDGGTADAFAASLRALIANRLATPFRAGSCGVINSEWAEASAPVAGLLQQPLDWRLAPFYSVTSLNRGELNHRVLYFNLHGFDGDPAWKSYDSARDQFLDVVTPDSFSPENVAGSLVISEACYGAQVVARTPGNSCAVRLQTEGALAVIGATGLVFGSVLQPWLTIDNADQFVPVLLQSARSGKPLGSVLVEGRQQFLEKCKRDGNPPNSYERKTALQFILLGDPSVPLP